MMKRLFLAAALALLALPVLAQQQVQITQATDAAQDAAAEESADKAATETKDQQVAAADAKPSEAEKTDEKPVDPEEAKLQKEQKEAEDLKAAIAKDIGSLGKLAEGLTVTPAEGGLLVSLTDQLNTPMFNVGSALPKKEMVVAMEKIGKILADRKGAIAIRGHTDGRPFKGEGNDNWRLSMSRAQSAYYMLVRGGLDETRISQVSGFADRRLKVPDDPFADVNRRIEILIQSEEG